MMYDLATLKATLDHVRTTREMLQDLLTHLDRKIDLISQHIEQAEAAPEPPEVISPIEPESLLGQLMTRLSQLSTNTISELTSALIGLETARIREYARQSKKDS